MKKWIIARLIVVEMFLSIHTPMTNVHTWPDVTPDGKWKLPGLMVVEMFPP